MKNKNKNKDTKDRVAEMHDVTRGYVNKVLAGDRDNEAIVKSYEMISILDEKVDKVIKETISPNK